MLFDNDDILEHIAAMLEPWDYETLSTCSCLCKRWRAACAPALVSLPERVQDAIADLYNDELLRRPVMWDIRREHAMDMMALRARTRC